MRDPGRLAHIDPLSGLLGGFDGVLHDAKKQPDKDAPKGPQETPKARLKPTEADSARAKKTPTAAQVKEVNDLLAQARKHFNWADVKEIEAGTKAAQRAIDLAVKYYGLENSHASQIVFSWGDATRAAHVDKDAVVHIHSKALIDAPSLAATIVHEATHANQIKLHGPNEGTDRNVLAQNHAAREVMGHRAALASADAIGLSEDKKKWYANEIDTYKGQLSKDNLKLLESGQYWGMKAGQPGE